MSARTNQPGLKSSIFARNVSVLVAVLLGLAVPIAAQETWPTYQANANHDGYIPVTIDPSTYGLLWETEFIPPVRDVNPVAAGGGMVFATLRADSYSGIYSFFGIDATDGAVLWREGFGEVGSVNPPAYADGKVYLQVGNHSNDTHLYEYDAASGTRLNDGPFLAQWQWYLAPTPFNGRVFINGGYYGGMYSFDFSQQPAEQWFVDLYQFSRWTPAVDGQFAYAHAGPEVTIVDAELGTVVGTIPDPNYGPDAPVFRSPVLGGDDDLLAIQDGRLISFDLSTLTVRYEVPDEFNGQVSVRQGVVYCINHGDLEARDQATSTFLWEWEPPAGWELTDSMIVMDSHVIVRAEQTSHPYHQATYAVDLTSHLDVWSYPQGGHLAWSDGVLLIARDDGVLTALTSDPPVFLDGFNSGVTFAWSESVGEPDPDLDVTIDPHFPATPAASCSPPEPLVVGNSGLGPLEIESLTLAGQFFFNLNYNQTRGPFTVLPGTVNTLLSVYFCPNYPPSGTTYHGSLEITSNDPASPEILALTGTEYTPPEILTGPFGHGDTWTFPDTVAGFCSTPEQLEIYNPGPWVGLEITSALSSDPQFVILNPPPPGTIIGAGELYHLDVEFCPAGVGMQSGQLSIGHTASNAPNPIVIELSGNGIGTASRDYSPPVRAPTIE